jgi:hypothetical protein
VYTLGVITIVAGFLFAGAIVFLRKAKPIMASSPLFGYIMCGGAILQGAAIILAQGQSDGGCTGYFICFSLGL